ncbi:hypothetical protein CY0110_16222 [Crocosphaera chwakensis CCY0110]|uniref:Uncharacterized protein n=1 Tax=Crocosphaera chwakensis CCY0110 TaxID=391612 RepID=A3IHS6_9CHRO|nr:hypothetical protein CY0110_16222 [Crocosphaera chwakensis CCY0110]
MILKQNLVKCHNRINSKIIVFN